MKLAIVGWRKFNDFKLLKEKIEQTLEEWDIDVESIEAVISGGAAGTDSLAECWAKSNKIPLQVFLPDWKQHGRAAGPLRNSLIIAEATHVIAFPSKQGRGTQDSISKARQSNKELAVHWIGGDKVEKLKPIKLI